MIGWEHWGSPFSDDVIVNSIVCPYCKARYVEIEEEVFNFCPNCGSPVTEKALEIIRNRKRGEIE